jgi:TolA-binding protein
MLRDKHRRTTTAIAVLAIGTLLPLGVLAQDEEDADAAEKARAARSPTKADDAWYEESRKAEEERDKRAPTVVKEKEREKVVTRDKPTIEVEDFMRKSVEKKIGEKRDTMIAQLDKILAQTRDERERPALLFQKAELFLENSQYYFFEGMEIDDKIADAMADGKDSKVLALQKKKKKLLDKSKIWTRDAVLLFQEIEDTYPDFERMPDVLFALGRAFWDVNRYKRALRAYRKIIKNYPKSQYLPDAWLAFGEFFFQLADDDERDLNKALDAYINAAKDQESQIFGYAVYKQGWCYYNLMRHDKAAERFKEVVLYSQINEELMGAKGIALAREARRDFVLAYAQFGGARAAPGEFKTLADPNSEDYFKMLEKLGDIYYGNGKDRDAIIIYQILMKMRPNSSRNPLFQGKVVKLASRIGIKRQVVGQARKLTEEWQKARKAFKKLKKGSPEWEKYNSDLEAAEDVSDNTLRFLATTWHREAKKTRDENTYKLSYELYGDYLELFPNKKEAYEMRFFYAELLWKLEMFQQAGEQYTKVWETNPKGKWAAAAAEEAVRAWDEVVKDYNRKKKEKPPTGANALKERPIPDVKKKYIGACNLYLKHYPKGKIVVEAKYKVARTLYDYNYFKDSTPRFLDIVDKHTKHDRAIQSANLVLDTFNILEDWARMNEVARKLVKNRVLMKDDDFKTTLMQVLEESSFKLINDFEQRKEWEEAGKKYLAFTAEFPKSELADKALANAAAMFNRAGQKDREIKVRKQLVNQFPKSPLVPEQIYNIAVAYEQIVAYREAAGWLEQFVDKVTDKGKKKKNIDSRAKDALYNASIYWQGVGETGKAVKGRERYLEMYGKSSDAEDIAYSICTAWEEAGNKKKAIECFLDFSKKWRRKAPERSLNSHYKAVRMLQQRGRRYQKEAEKETARLRGSARTWRNKPSVEVADPLSYLAFLDANKPYDAFLKQKIERPDKPKKFKKTLAAKIKAKDGVYEAYTRVVKLKSPEWAVASLYRIGMAHDHLVHALQSVPAPKIFTDEQKMLFKDKLSQEALPIEDQAAQAMVLCLDKSAEYGVFNEWTQKCLSYLEEKRPNQFPKNTLEERPPVLVKARTPQQGTGFVFELPKKGARVAEQPGTAPTPPLAGDPIRVKKTVTTPSAASGGGEEKPPDDFDFEGGQ